MKFCSECGGLIVPVIGEKYSVCRSCKRKYATEEEAVIVDKRDSEQKDIKILDEEQSDFRTTTSVTCPKCGEHKAEWTIRQMRGGDEAPTEFYRCLSCKWVWRVNG